MNFTEEEKNILGQDLLDTVSKPLPNISQVHIRVDLPFPIEEILQLESIEAIQKLKLRMAQDSISIFCEYPTLHGIGFFKHSEHFHASITQVAWDTSEAIKETAEYKKSNVNIHAFTHNSLNGKRHIKFIRNKDNNMVSYDDITIELRNKFSYMQENGNSELLLNHLRSNHMSSMVCFNVVNWYGSIENNFPKKLEEFLGKEFINALNYIKMNESLPRKENAVRKSKKI